MVLLGTLPTDNAASHSPAILRIERTPVNSDICKVLPSILQDIKVIERTDIVSLTLILFHPLSLTVFMYVAFSYTYQYSWLLAWLTKHENLPDVKINIVCPATDVHIRKVD